MLPLDIAVTTTQLILGALTFVASALAAWLMWRGKKADNKVAVRNANYDELERLAKSRLEEINRLQAAKTAADDEVDRVRTSWEQRWDRQMSRCRGVTDKLVDVVAMLKTPPKDHLQPGEEIQVDEVLQELQEHREDDHPEDWMPVTPEST